MLGLFYSLWLTSVVALHFYEQNVSLNATSNTTVVLETLHLATPVTLTASRKYAFTLFFEYARLNNPGRTYVGGWNQIPSQCGLFITISNSSWARNAFDSFQKFPPSNFDFFLGLGTSVNTTFNMLSADALTGVVFLRSTDDQGFGQTFDSGAGGVLHNLTLLLGTDMSKNYSLEATLRLYDLGSLPVTQNVDIEVADTKAPTTPAPTAPTTPQPTKSPTLPTPQPTISPTTIGPTKAPTTATPTTSPTTATPTKAPTTPAPTSSPTTAAPTTAAPSTLAPTAAPSTLAPSVAPSTLAPSSAPSISSAPTKAPSAADNTVSGSPSVGAGLAIAIAASALVMIFF